MRHSTRANRTSTSRCQGHLAMPWYNSPLPAFVLVDDVRRDPVVPIVPCEQNRHEFNSGLPLCRASHTPLKLRLANPAHQPHALAPSWRPAPFCPAVPLHTAPSLSTRRRCSWRHVLRHSPAGLDAPAPTVPRICTRLSIRTCIHLEHLPGCLQDNVTWILARAVASSPYIPQASHWSSCALGYFISTPAGAHAGASVGNTVRVSRCRYHGDLQVSSQP